MLSLSRHAAHACAVLLLALSSVAVHAAVLEAAAWSGVRAATFEIVMRKPQTDSLTYERRLPLELLPYAERNDDYISIGTAFALGGNRYVTAAHVLESGFSTQFGEPAVRTADGAVHAIGHIHKYSRAQDFVVFSLKDRLEAPGLPVNRDPELNDVVFAVGNALGEGIVIRDGLFTSQTPEERDGAWKWLRFSAAASPGNSGGPLLDAQGRVIGVVLRKSENENLNYAAPISLILDAPDNVAALSQDGYFYISVMSPRESGRKEAIVPLPKTFAELARAVESFDAAFFAELKAELLRKHAHEIFPKGEGAQALLNATISSEQLGLIAQKDDGAWDVFRAENVQTANLRANGYVAHGEVADFLFMKIRRADDQAARAFYTDSKLYGDTILKAIRWSRDIGAEAIRVTSFGKAREESVHVDPYGRKWQLRFWNVEYMDSVLVSMALPTPDGYLGVLRMCETAEVPNVLDEMQTLTGFAYASYTGTLGQWRDWLTMKPLTPSVFDGYEIRADYGQRFSFVSPRVELLVPHSVQPITADNRLTINFSYFEDAGRVVWDAAGLVLADSVDGSQALVFARHPRPPESLPQSYRTLWRKLSRREYPFNSEVVNNAANSTIATVYPFKGELSDRDAVRYEFAIAREGRRSQEELSTALQEYLRGVKVKER